MRRPLAWWIDVLSALDSVTTAGFGTCDPDIAAGLTWFVDHQQPNALWARGRDKRA